MKTSTQIAQKRILCIADLPNWIFNRHIETLKRFLGDEFKITTTYRGLSFDEQEYDLIYPLEYMLVDSSVIRNSSKYVTGIRSYISWAEKDFLPFVEHLYKYFQRVHVVSQELYNIFSPYLPSVCYITHGVDLDFFAPTKQQTPRAGQLCLGWAGRRDTFIKGYRDYIQPLEDLPGVELNICGFVDRNLTMEEMPAFYSSIDAYVCATSFEGSNNTILEAAAMERAIITTRVGTVPELFTHRKDALIIDRDPREFRKAVEELRDNPGLRIMLGKNARETLIEKQWDWKIKAEEFRQFFRTALENVKAESIDTIHTPIRIQDKAHYLGILQAQNKLLREMRTGDWIMIYDLNQNINNLKKEIEAIRNSETYRIVERIKASKIGQFLIRVYQILITEASPKGS